MKQDIILTGIRSNSIPTLGNYLGAFLPMMELQRKYVDTHQINMFVPDLHSFTTPVDHSDLYQNTIRNLKFYVAAGLDITNPNIFMYRQSFVPAHSEMTWILNCFAYFGELSRMTQFKEKSQQQTETVDTTSATVALFDYPVLMAADILLYGARWIPVGEDQRQHLELARDLAQRLNNKFAAPLFVVPEPWDKQMQFVGRDAGVRIRSLTNPDKKMSKSISDPRGTILLTDDPKDAAKKVMSATTDSFGEVQFDLRERPGISNLLQILSLLSGKPQAEVIATWQGSTRYGELKTAVAQEVATFLTDFQARLAAVDELALIGKLEQSEEAMREASAPVLHSVQQAVGLRPKI